MRARGHDFGQHAFAGHRPTLSEMRSRLREEMKAFRSRYGHEPVTYRGHSLIWVGWTDMAMYLNDPSDEEVHEAPAFGASSSVCQDRSSATVLGSATKARCVAVGTKTRCLLLLLGQRGDQFFKLLQPGGEFRILGTQLT